MREGKEKRVWKIESLVRLEKPNGPMSVILGEEKWKRVNRPMETKPLSPLLRRRVAEGGGMKKRRDDGIGYDVRVMMSACWGA